MFHNISQCAARCENAIDNEFKDPGPEYNNKFQDLKPKYNNE